jgi:hypothetical protein
MAQRIKGQEVEVLLVANGTPLLNITTVRSFEFEFQLETKKEGYLGETTDRRDSIYMGVSGQLELHFETKDVFDLVQTIVNKARRRTPGDQINIKAALNFPNGQRVRVMIADAEFGGIPFSFGGRTEYGSVRLTFEAAEATTLSS